MAGTAGGGCRAGGGPVFGGSIWMIGWLFVIGYLHLPFWRAVLGLIIWPYYLGTALGPR